MVRVNLVEIVFLFPKLSERTVAFCPNSSLVDGLFGN